MEESVMKFSRRHLLASSLALAGVLGVLPEVMSQQAHAASSNGAPLGQVIWLQTTNNHNYVSTRTDQTNSPLEAIVTQVQAWEEFDVLDAGNGLIALRSHANNNYVSARIDQTNAP